MDSMRQCKRCHKLFLAAGDELCAECAQERYDLLQAVDEAIDKFGYRTVDSISEHTGLPRDEVLAVVKESSFLRRQVQTGELCMRCRQEPAQPDSAYCFDCRLTLNKELSDASDELQEKSTGPDSIDPSSPASTQRMDVAQRLNEKRRPSSVERFTPTPRGKYG